MQGRTVLSEQSLNRKNVLAHLCSFPKYRTVSSDSLTTHSHIWNFLSDIIVTQNTCTENNLRITRLKLITLLYKKSSTRDTAVLRKTTAKTNYFGTLLTT